MSHWTFGATLPALLAGAMLWAAAGWLSYSHWERAGRRRVVGRLEALRFGLITLLTATLLRPEFIHTVRRTEAPEVAVLLDVSRSMDTRDVTWSNAVMSRAEWVAQARASRYWEPLERNGRVVVEEFAPPPKGTNGTGQRLVEGTDLNEALDRALARGRNLKAVLLLSDGDWNLGESPVSAATRFREAGVPIYAVQVGRETPLPDLVLASVSPPAYGLFGEDIAIPFKIQSHLAHDVKTVVRLRQGDREEARKEVVIPAQGELEDAILWSPHAVGTAVLTLSVPVQPDESLADNNTQTFRINVRVDKLKVLVVDSVPRWEYRFLRNALARDPGVEMNCILFLPGLGPGRGLDYLPAFPDTKESLSPYDVIFLGDVGIGQDELTANDAELIRGLVQQQGSGLVLVPGRRGREATLVHSPLQDLFPVVLDANKPRGIALRNESTLVVTAAGAGHWLTRFDADAGRNAEIWRQLPGFFWSAAVVKSRPGAEVLAVHSTLRNEWGRLPLLVTRSYGNGKVLFLGTDSAWRWRRGVEDKYHYRFWSQVVRWMAHQRHLAGRPGIRLSFSPEVPQLGDTIFLQATVLDRAGLPIDKGPVTGTITSPSGRTEELGFTPLGGGWGVFKTQFTPQEGGRYKVSVAAKQYGRELATELLVDQPWREKLGQPVNREILGEIAAITHGASGRYDSLASMVRQITLLPAPKPIQQRVRLWSSPWWGGFLLLLLGIYWAGRKLAGML